MVTAMNKLEQTSQNLEKIVLDAELDALTSENAIRSSNPTAKLTIGTKVYEIGSNFYHLTIGEMVETWRDDVEAQRIEQYLRGRYPGFKGVPVSQLSGEMGVTSHQAMNFAKMHFDSKPRGKLEDCFLEFGDVAQGIILLSHQEV